MSFKGRKRQVEPSDQAHRQPEPFGGLDGEGGLGGRVPEGLAQKFQRQALTGIAEGGGGFGGQVL